MKPKSLFLDGKMKKADSALLASLEPGVVEGKGVFETMRVCNGEIRGLKEHFSRLSRGLRSLKIHLPCSKKKLEQYLYRTLKANGLRQARIRLSIWRERRRLRMAIVCQPFNGYSNKKYKKGFKAVVSDIKRKKTKFSHIKSLDYECFRQAFLEAQDAKCDEAVLLNNRGEIVEGSRTNIFFVRKGVLYTPAIRCGALNGITRRGVIRCARKTRIPCKVIAARLQKLFQAEEAFVTNSLMGIMPLTIVSGRPIGSGTIGPVTKKLLSAYYTNSHSSCPVPGKSV